MIPSDLVDDGALMAIAEQQIDWIAEKHATSRGAGRLALLSVLMHVREECAMAMPDSTSPARPAEPPADPEKDAAWFAIEHGWDIEPREFFEREAPTNGFKYPLAQAIHHLWKRAVKDNPDWLRSTPPTETLKMAACVWCGWRSKQTICPHCKRERDSGIKPPDATPPAADVEFVDPSSERGQQMIRNAAYLRPTTQGDPPPGEGKHSKENEMKTCRHLKAFRINVTVTDPEHAALPPWMSLCENCAADVVDGLRKRIADVAATKHSGKSSHAVIVARLRRILDDLLGWQMEWRPNDERVVEQFKARLGADFFNHGGLLRVTAKGSTVGDEFVDGVHELHDGDWLIIDADGTRRVSLKGATS